MLGSVTSIGPHVIKLFHENENEQEILILRLRLYNQDIGMGFAMKMCHADIVGITKLQKKWKRQIVKKISSFQKRKLQVLGNIRKTVHSGQ